MRISYTIKEKGEIVSYAMARSQAEASAKFGVHKSMVSRWVKDYQKLLNASPLKKRLSKKKDRIVSSSDTLVGSPVRCNLEKYLQPKVGNLKWTRPEVPELSDADDW